MFYSFIENSDMRSGADEGPTPVKSHVCVVWRDTSCHSRYGTPPVFDLATSLYLSFDATAIALFAAPSSTSWHPIIMTAAGVGFSHHRIELLPRENHTFN